MKHHSTRDHWTVLLGGEIIATERLRRQVAGTRIVAADSGIRHADVLGVTPDLWIGDFDSSDKQLQARYSMIPRQAHPTAKNATDGDLAIAAAIAGGARHVTLVGAFGGRADQATAHMLMALRLTDEGKTVVLSSGLEEAIAVGTSWVEPDWPLGTRFSVLAFSDLRDLSIVGARWPLSNVNVAIGDTLGVSNEVTSRVKMKAYGRCIAVATLE